MTRLWSGKSHKTLVLLAVTALGLACRSGGERDDLTGSTALTGAPLAENEGLFSTSGRDGEVLICHKNREIRVAPSAVPAHLAHGDHEGSCVECPCYSPEQVAAAASCPGAIPQCVRIGSAYLCQIACASGTYDFFLAADHCSGPATSSPVDADQHQACYEVLLTECPAFDF